MERNQRAFIQLYAIEQTHYAVERALDRRSLPTGRRPASPRCRRPGAGRSREARRATTTVLMKRRGKEVGRLHLNQSPRGVMIRSRSSTASSSTPTLDGRRRIGRRSFPSRKATRATRPTRSENASPPRQTWSPRSRTRPQSARTAPHQPMGGGSSPSSAAPWSGLLKPPRSGWPSASCLQ